MRHTYIYMNKNNKKTKDILKSYVNNLSTVKFNDWNFVIFEKCETYKQLKETERAIQT